MESPPPPANLPPIVNKRFCLFSPSTWTKTIALLDIMMRTTFIVLETSAIVDFLSYGHIYRKETSLALFFAADHFITARFPDNWVAVCSVSIMRHSLGLIIACLLLIGAMKRISKFLHLWCVFALIDTVLNWMSSVFQMRLGFFYLKGIVTVIVLFFGFIVLTLVDEIDTEKRKQRVQRRGHVQDGGQGESPLVNISVIHGPGSMSHNSLSSDMGRRHTSFISDMRSCQKPPPPYEQFMPPSYAETILASQMSKTGE